MEIKVNYEQYRGINITDFIVEFNIEHVCRLLKKSELTTEFTDLNWHTECIAITTNCGASFFDDEYQIVCLIKLPSFTVLEKRIDSYINNRVFS